MALAKAFERFYYDFSLYDQVKHAIPSRGQYVALRHIAFCTVGLVGLIDVFFPFNDHAIDAQFHQLHLEPLRTVTLKRTLVTLLFCSLPAGMCPSGWKGTWVCENDKHKALEMYKAWKAGKEYVETPHHH